VVREARSIRKSAEFWMTRTKRLRYLTGIVTPKSVPVEKGEKRKSEKKREDEETVIENSHSLL
jgi:hypothetical protein